MDRYRPLLMGSGRYRWGLAVMDRYGPLWLGTGRYGWGPAVGATIPGFELTAADGSPRTAEELMGAKGLLVFYNRSVDW